MNPSAHQSVPVTPLTHQIPIQPPPAAVPPAPLIPPPPIAPTNPPPVVQQPPQPSGAIPPISEQLKDYPNKPIRDPQTGQIITGVAQDTNKHGTAGRPTLYKPEYCDQIIEYFDIEPSRMETRTEHYGKDTVIDTPVEIANDLPTLEGFSQKIGVTPNTLAEWSKTYPDFSSAITRAKAMQKHILMNNGLKKLYDGRFAIFVATNVTDLKSKTITEETGERKIIVEHRDFVNERRVIDAELPGN